MTNFIVVLLAFTLLPAIAFAAGKPGAPVRIALVSDTHTNRSTVMTPEEQPLYKGRLDAVIADVNTQHVDVVLVAGDLTQGGRPEQISDFKSQVKGFHAPVLVVPGNHDVGDKHIPGKTGGVTEERVAQYVKAFGPGFWAKTVKGVRIIGIDSSLLGSGLPQEAEQWDFLEKQLSKPSDKPTLILTHYPLFVTTPDEPGGGYWNMEPAPRARLLALLQQGHVTAVLTGHLHRPLTTHVGPLLSYTTPPVSFGIPLGKQPEGWTLVTVSPAGAVDTQFRSIVSITQGAEK